MRVLTGRAPGDAGLGASACGGRGEGDGRVTGPRGRRSDRAPGLEQVDSALLLPCDVLARVAPVADQVAQLEVDIAQRLAEVGSPVAALAPRVTPGVHERDGFVVTLWTYYEPAVPREVPPAAYADALTRLHAGMRQLDVPAPHFTVRVDQAQRLLADRDRTPALADADRRLLDGTLRSLRRAIGERRYRRPAAALGGRTREICSPPRAGPSSSTWRPAAGAPSNSISPTRPTTSPSTTRTPTRTCCTTAASSSSR
ncbi:hypothetical protein SGRIM119S_02309 [Streptomyces griseorubiginosus]